jgi:SAM-dependent methyltransferase
MTGASAETRRDALVERVFEAVLGFNDVYMIYVGERLGLYAALRDGAATPGEVAAATGTKERYVREWLEHQAVAGILEAVESPGDGERRFRIPAGHDEVLLDRDSAAYMAAFARMQVGIAEPIAAVIEAFRTGEGVPYARYPVDFLEGQGDMNRVQYVNLLGTEWLPAVPEVDERLRREPPARVADVACGVGWSSISVARAYPLVRVDGCDVDDASIELARANVAAEGLGDRVSFEAREAAALPRDGRYDLVMVFEAIHDMAQPVEALRAMREAAAPDGVVLVVDERAADTFEAPGDAVERMLYGWSVFHCLPVGLAEQPSVATGTVMRRSTLERYAREAGFSGVDVLPIENDFWRFYRLR